jgi:hypothetical protein
LDRELKNPTFYWFRTNIPQLLFAAGNLGDILLLHKKRELKNPTFYWFRTNIPQLLFAAGNLGDILLLHKKRELKNPTFCWKRVQRLPLNFTISGDYSVQFFLIVIATL